MGVGDSLLCCGQRRGGAVMAEPPVTIQAYHTSGGSNFPVTRVVIHDEEYPVSDTSAEAIARYFASSDAGGSAHYCVDANSEQHCVADGVIAWHAPPNQGSIGIEQDGYARFSYNDWQTPGSQATMRRAAWRTNELCDRFGVPKVWLSVQDLLNGAHGVTSHNNVSQAWHQSDHNDPGGGFPVAQFMGYVTGAPVPPTPPPPPPPTGDFVYPPTLAQGSPDRNRVNVLQGCLCAGAAAGLCDAVSIDGDFGPGTAAALRTYQSRLGLPADAIVGPPTWARLFDLP